MIRTNKTIALPPTLLRFTGVDGLVVLLAASVFGSDFGAEAAFWLSSALDVPPLAEIPGLAAEAVSVFLVLAPGLAVPLLSTEMVADGFSVSVDLVEALVLGVSGVFTIGPLQFAVIPKTASGTASRYDGA
jgi:hypothetical protein